MNGINNIQAEGQLYDILAPEVVNDYVEKLGKPCANPNGYTTGSLILATDGGNVQRLYKVTQAINSSQNIVEDGNVVRKKLGDLFDDLEVALNDEIDDVDTELGNVKQALNNEVETRAELGAHNLLRLDDSTFKYASSNTSYTKIDTGVEIANTTSQTFSSITWTLTYLKPNTDYILSCDVTKISGAGRIIIQGNDSSTRILDQNNLITGSHVSASFNTGTIANLCIIIYSTSDTAATGDVKYENLMIRSASDTDPTYQPYAMTNKELTDSKAEKSDLASINITGTTNNTGSSIVSGTYFYLNGQLVRAKTSIANNATLTLNTNYEKVTAGALNNLVAITEVTAKFSDGATQTISLTPPIGHARCYAISGMLAAGNADAIQYLQGYSISGDMNVLVVTFKSDTPSAAQVTFKLLWL